MGSGVRHSEQYAKLINTQERRGLTTLPSKPLFCVVAWSEGQSPDASRFDLAATDGQQAWQLSGAGAPPPDSHMLMAEEYMAACKAALCSPQPTDDYQFIVTRSNTRLRLDLRWRSVPIGGMATIQLDLTPVIGDGVPTTMASMLELLCTGYASLKASVDQLTCINKQLDEQLSNTRSQLTKQKQESTQREEDLYIKFSMLLNTKKARLRELQDEVLARGQQIQELEQRLNQVAIAQGESDPGAGSDTDREDGISKADEYHIKEEQASWDTNMDVDAPAHQAVHEAVHAAPARTAIAGVRGVLIQGQAASRGLHMSDVVLPAASGPVPCAAVGVSAHDVFPVTEHGMAPGALPSGSELQALMDAETQPQVDIVGTARQALLGGGTEQDGGGTGGGQGTSQGVGAAQFTVWAGDTQPLHPGVWHGQRSGQRDADGTTSNVIKPPSGSGVVSAVADQNDVNCKELNEELDLGL